MRYYSSFALHQSVRHGLFHPQSRQFSKILPSTSHSDENIKIITKEWIDKWVIGLQLCPFASTVMKANKVKMVINRGTLPKAEDEESVAKFLGVFVSEAAALAGKELGIDKAAQEVKIAADYHDCDTTLLILPKMKEYEEFKDLVEIIERNLDKMMLAPWVQVSSYHPLFKVEPRFRNGELLDTPVDVYSKRSPYPIIQLLKQTHLQDLCLNYTLKHNPPSTGRGRVKNRSRKIFDKIAETMDRVVQRNTQLMRELGLGKVRTMLRDLYADAPIVKDSGSNKTS